MTPLPAKRVGSDYTECLAHPESWVYKKWHGLNVSTTKEWNGKITNSKKMNGKPSRLMCKCLLPWGHKMYKPRLWGRSVQNIMVHASQQQLCLAGGIRLRGLGSMGWEFAGRTGDRD